MWHDVVVRLYSSGGTHGTAWSAFRAYGPVATMRFDHHPPPRRLHPSRAVMYAAGAWTSPEGLVTDPLEVAVLERFQGSGIIDRETDAPRLTLWRPRRPLRLLRLSDSSWLTRAGGNAALMAGPRGVAREWARAVYRAYPSIDGLVWSSSLLPPGRSLMLFERARDAVPAAPLVDRALSERALQPALARIATTYGLTLV